MTFISDRNGTTSAAGGESQVASALVGISVGSADGTHARALMGCARAPAGALDAMRAQVLVQQAASPLTTPYPSA